MPEAIRNVVDLFVQEIRNVLGEDLKKVIVYGSYARGDYREGSDVDVMVLTSLTDEVIKPVEYKLYDVAFDFLMEYGVDISIIVKNEEHFKYWLGALPFYDNVVKDEGYLTFTLPVSTGKIIATKALATFAGGSCSAVL